MFGNQSSVNTANALQMMSGLLSKLANAGSQASAKKYNSAEAAAERAFQKEMRGTAYQDTVKDMIAAGTPPKAAPPAAPPAAEVKAVHFFKRKGAPPKAAVLLIIILDNIGKTI